MKLEIESNTSPLTSQELTMRLLTRDYAQQFFIQVEKTADGIISQTSLDDVTKQSLLLLWKINAYEGMQSSAYQVSPMASLIDTWVFTRQQQNFFNSGVGSLQLDHVKVREAVDTLNDEMENLAHSLLSISEFNEVQRFVETFVEQHFFQDFNMDRAPAYRAWLGSHQLDEDVTLGTMTETIGDMTDRIALVGNQTPKLMTWKSQLLLMHNTTDINKISSTLDSIKSTSESVQDLINNHPEYIDHLTRALIVTLEPLINDIDNKADAYVAVLSHERQAIENMVGRERMELGVLINQQRIEFSRDIDRISQKVVEQSVNKLIELIKNTLVYFVFALLFILGTPLLLGYRLGKRSSDTTSA